MRIQHNIPAMNAYRNYNANTKALQGNLQKLSSGYKINKAGDDAAGLAISEKMRAQITGLEVAQKNAKDGISLVQTAEGAMTEIHTMLNRMFSLAEQSANGTYDNEVDREQLNNEFDKLRTEIDRIAQATNFNGKKLLDGKIGSDTASTTNTTAIDPVDGAISSATNAANLGSATITFDTAATDDQKNALNEALAGQKLTVTVKSNATANAPNPAGGIVKFEGLPSDQYDLKITDQSGAEVKLREQIEIGTGAGKLTAAGPMNISLYDKESGAKVADLAIAYKTTNNSWTANDFVSEIKFKTPVKGEGDVDTSDTTHTTNLGNLGIASIDLGDITVKDGDAVTGEYTASKELKIKVGSDEFVYTADETSVSLQGQEVELKTADGSKSIKVTLDAAQIVVGSDKTTAVNGGAAGTGNPIGTVKVGGDDTDENGGSTSGLRLRVGDSTEGYDNIYVDIKSMKMEDLVDMTDKAKGGTGLTLDKLGIGYATEADAAKAAADGVKGVTKDMNADTAMKALKGMINYVSNERGKLGATQNRLDHTINNLSTMQENIQDAEATIRDVDVAEEMMKYTKNNILVQSAQAMLAQANQLPQGVLQLLG